MKPKNFLADTPKAHLSGFIFKPYRRILSRANLKSAGLGNHLADLRLALERMRRYGLKMNPLKCAFGVSAGKFLGFIIHEKGIEIDPK